jgi:hypothetical protein
MVLKAGEWRGLVILLEAYADGNPERATNSVDMKPEQLARNYADEIKRQAGAGSDTGPSDLANGGAE